MFKENEILYVRKGTPGWHEDLNGREYIYKCIIDDIILVEPYGWRLTRDDGSTNNTPVGVPMECISDLVRKEGLISKKIDFLRLI
jgi:hypothetical protein